MLSKKRGLRSQANNDFLLGRRQEGDIDPFVIEDRASH